ncbi:hypothetical protein LTR82_017981 [Friedmanniomyces endolithicus]|uniref:Uncharacterized protein n=1 Tax=Friedmanniomyces endolithicus TaxID=329885 RepID=A0AAN6J3T4_9PEZI|nr:hypothetical protein LTR82_017981 [Friedmanniomyces endolithicus]
MAGDDFERNGKQLYDEHYARLEALACYGYEAPLTQLFPPPLSDTGAAGGLHGYNICPRKHPIAQYRTIDPTSQALDTHEMSPIYGYAIYTPPTEVPEIANRGTLPHLYSKCIVIRHHLHDRGAVPHSLPRQRRSPRNIRRMPGGVYLQGIQSKMRRVRHGKVDKSQGHSSFYVHARECLFFSQSGLGEGQVALHEDILEQHSSRKLTPEAQLYKDSGYSPDAAARGAVGAQSGLQWSDTEPDSDRGLDSCEEIRKHVETPTKERFCTTAFYRVLPHHRANTTRTMLPREAKAPAKRKLMYNNIKTGPAVTLNASK